MKLKTLTKALFPILAVAYAGSALAQATDTAMWTGTVPVESTPGTDFKIVSTGLVDLSNGNMKFVSENGGYVLSSASLLSFDVVKTDDSPVTDYTYEINNFTFSDGTTFGEDATDVGFELKDGSGNDLSAGQEQTGVTGQTELVLSGTGLGLTSGTNVVVMSQIVVSAATL
ncbi:hypothetical protein GCM10007916_28700 [Psychromonas marina]|uniref:Uncharacterized protein n=1 Tax=Psychromonas marina TaxID=88364 RepID=A0ABQ6E3P1_9GAMM|nr:hypothetical protein [Psychromonas marina]GLS91800.1 hypothetical protein GCM10007916_28700 [Psychromonas marina]